MKVIEIESSSNQRLKLIRALAQSGRIKDCQDDDELILLEGSKLIQEALNHAVKLQDVVVSHSYYQDNFNKTDLATRLESISVVKDNIFKGLYTTDTSCGIIATGTPKHYDLTAVISKAKTLLIGDSIQDPGNLGTIIRTAYAFSADGIILSKGSVDCYNPKVIRSSMGAIFALPLITKVDLKAVIERLKERGVFIIALDGKATQTVWQDMTIHESIAYVLGNEGHGISADIVKMVNSIVRIPINPDCESLNVAVAAAIILVRNKLKIADKNKS